MNKRHESELQCKTSKGMSGLVKEYNLLEGSPVVSIHEITSRSDIPQRPHIPDSRQVYYLIDGHCTISNQLTTYDLYPGDFVEVEPGEAHYIKTGNRSAKLMTIIFE